MKRLIPTKKDEPPLRKCDEGLKEHLKCKWCSCDLVGPYATIGITYKFTDLVTIHVCHSCFSDIRRGELEDEISMRKWNKLIKGIKIKGYLVILRRKRKFRGIRIKRSDQSTKPLTAIDGKHIPIDLSLFNGPTTISVTNAEGVKQNYEMYESKNIVAGVVPVIICEVSGDEWGSM
jgi:hypothetical protein